MILDPKLNKISDTLDPKLTEVSYNLDVFHFKFLRLPISDTDTRSTLMKLERIFGRTVPGVRL